MNIFRFTILLFFFQSILFTWSCSFTKKVKTGEMAYDLKQYAVAIDMLQEEFEEYTNQAHKARAAFLLGKSYEKILDYNNAVEWFTQANDFKYGPEALHQKAMILKQQEKYESASSIWNELKAKNEYRVIAEREILICKEASRWKSNPEPYQIGKFVESMGYSHFAPVFYRDRYLVLTSDRQEATGKTLYAWTGEKFSDLFLFSTSGNYISPFDPVINSTHNEGTPCFTKDFETIYFTRCQRESPSNDDCKIMVSSFEEGVWTEPENLHFTLPDIQYGHPVLLENDSVLVFSSDLINPGGTFDLYYAELLENGSWSDPERMPSSINTDGNEKFPTADGDTLYFSSDYIPGMGGYDIFKTFLRKDRKWSNPINMKYPINSGADDFSLIIDRNFQADENRNEKGYFSSSRSMNGFDEVFFFTKYKKPEIIKETVPEPKAVSYFIGGKTWKEQFVNDNPNEEKLPDEILEDVRIQLFSQEDVLLEETRSSQTGIYLFEVKPNTTYVLKANKSQFLTSMEEADTRQLKPIPGEETATLQVDLVLSKIYLNQEVNLDNIYYEYDQWNLTPEAYPTLEKLALLMKANPALKIQLNAHTDCRGEDDYNLELSQKRAQSVVNYLVENGIVRERLVAVGHGETKPNVVCECVLCTEAEHQKNRRTSFTILSLMR